VTAGLLAGSVLGGALGSWLLDAGVSAQGPAVVTTTQLNVVDEAGRLRAILAGRDAAGLTSLELYDMEGRVRTVLAVDEAAGPVLRMLTAAGQDRLVATLQGEDAVLVLGDDRAGNTFVGTLGGAPLVSLSQADRPRARLQLDARGSPALGLYGTSGERAADLGVDTTDAPVLTLYERGRPRTTLGVVQGTSVLNMADANRVRLVMGGREKRAARDQDDGPSL